MTLKTLCAVAACAILASPAGPAFAEPPADTPTTTQDTRTADQIAAYLATSPALDTAAPSSAAGAPRASADAPAHDGKVHGVAEVSVGSHGYRSVYLETHMPLGQSGELAIAIGDSRGGGRFGPGLGPGFGPGFGRGPHMRLAPCPNDIAADRRAPEGSACASAAPPPQ